MRIFYFILFLFVAQTLQFPFPKPQNLVLNVKQGNSVTSSEIAPDSAEPIKLKSGFQIIDMASSVFTKQKVSLKNGLHLIASINMAIGTYYYTDGVAVILQNHPDGNNYIGNTGVSLGVKGMNEECAGLTIRVFHYDNKSNLVIRFGDKEVYTLPSNIGFVDTYPARIDLQIQIIENDEALLTFGVGSVKQKAGPSSIKLTNFRKNLCLNDSDELSAFVGFSSSSLGSDCSHSVHLVEFKMADFGCGCPSDENFPLNIVYKKDITTLKSMEAALVIIEEPKVCKFCENYSGSNNEINLLINHIWKIKGKKIQSGNQRLIEFQLPQLSGDNKYGVQKHLMTFLIDDVSFAQKYFTVQPNVFLEENWFVPVNQPSNAANETYKFPLTGISPNKPTQPPNIPPLDNNVLNALNQKQDKHYLVDVYSRPIIQELSKNGMLEQSSERIKIDSVRIPVENSNEVVSVREWNPTQEIQIESDKYALQGQNYEYEIKHQDGTIIKTVYTHVEIILDNVMSSSCYGNYCTSFFCSSKPFKNPPPVSALDKVCKEMKEHPIIDKLNDIMTAAGICKIQLPKGGFISAALHIFDGFYVFEALLAKCDDFDKDCFNAKCVILAKFAFTFINPVGRYFFFLDIFNKLLEENYLDPTKIGKWLTSKFTGDPHIKNLDGCMFDFQGQGDFILIEEKLTGLAIHSRFIQHKSFSGVTTIKAIAVRGFYGAPVVYFESVLTEKNPLIRINGIVIQIENGKNIEMPNLKIRVDMDNYFIDYSHGVQLQITNHGYGFLWTGFITIPAVYSGKLQGIQGNGDSIDNENDFRPGSNTQVDYQQIQSCKQANEEDIWKFGQSWRLTSKEDSLLHYKANEDPNSFYDANWRPPLLQEIINKANSSQKSDAQRQCQSLKTNSEEDYQNCFIDQLLMSNQAKTSITVTVTDAYKNSKELPQEPKISLVYKNVTEISAGLEFGVNSALEKLCSKGCGVKILSQKAGEVDFKLIRQFSNTVQQLNIELLSLLDNNTIYQFKVQIDKYESNIVSFMTMKKVCVPFCAKENACGDDGCGNQCDEKVKCSTECKFGVCEARQNDNGHPITTQDAIGYLIISIVVLAFIFLLP